MICVMATTTTEGEKEREVKIFGTIESEYIAYVPPLLYIYIRHIYISHDVYHVAYIMHHESCIMYHASYIMRHI